MSRDKNPMRSLLANGGTEFVDACLVSCGSRKQPFPAQAQDLYVSELFSREKAFAQTFSKSWYILSAKHGLVKNSQILEPYDVSLNSKSAQERQEWAHSVSNALAQNENKPRSVAILAGANYTDFLVPSLIEQGIKVWEPLKGLGIGKQLQWLDDATRAPARLRETHLLHLVLEYLSSDPRQGLTLGEMTSQGLPPRGVYFFVDESEKSRIGKLGRIVRVGTHAVSSGSKSTLWQRLRTHRGHDDLSGSHRSSIFRLHVGAAYLNANNLVCSTWGIGDNASSEVRASERTIEEWVSSYIRKLRVFWLNIPDNPHAYSDRSYIERGIIGMLSHRRPLDMPGPSWLGSHSPKESIQVSGLWNLNYVGDQYPPETFEILHEYSRLTLEGMPEGYLSRAPQDWHLANRRDKNGRQGELL